MSTNPIVHDELVQVASQYQHVTQSASLLEPYKEPLLVLRAKYASYEQITEILNQRGVRVSLATVRKFCRKHSAEMKRMRVEIEEGKRLEAEAAAGSQPAIPLNLESTQRPPLTADAGQRGPRIARNDL